MSHRRIPFQLVCLGLVWAMAASAQDAGDTRPVAGISEHAPRSTVLANARVVVAPGIVHEKASVAIESTSIVAVGAEIAPAPGAEIIDCTGMTIYAGMIDAYGEVEVDEPPSDGTGHWNGYVLPRRASVTAVNSVGNASAYRSAGVTMRMIGPEGGIVKGTSCLILLDQSSGGTVVDDDVAQHLQLTIPRDRRRDSYPNSPMGAVALLRQCLLDADWYTRAWQAYRSDPQLTRPTVNEDLARLASDRAAGRFVIDAPNERMALRADRLAREFTIDAAIRGSGREYRDLEAIVATGRTLLIPVRFPDAPSVASESYAADVSLRDLMHWHFAPQNPARLADAGAAFCLTSDGLDDPKTFLKNLRVAVHRGLSSDQALAAVTTTPARWLGIDSVAGKVRPGALANLVVTDGDLFDDDTKVIETWVAGNRYRVKANTPPPPDQLIGSWQTSIPSPEGGQLLRLKLSREGKKWSGKMTPVPSESDEPTSDSESKEDSEDDVAVASVKLKDVVRAVDRLTAWVDLSELETGLPGGPSRMTVLTIDDPKQLELFATLTRPDGSQVKLTWTPIEIPENGRDETKDKEENNESGGDPSGSDERSVMAENPIDEIRVNYPLGGYGVTERIGETASVLFRGATVWTCGEAGVLERADILVVDGKIERVDTSIAPPKGCTVIDARGKHITPGLIDCHSHMATDGGVNESGQAVTSEVRVGDFVDNSDINIYRQLAGGLTIANILHGSANPIGGQNQVIKLRWGDSMEAMKLASAPQGIKFALGENVKRSNRSETPTRYPSSRMGVEQLFRDRFLAAKEYDAAHQRWKRGDGGSLPPRIDLELEAIAEILRAERWIHCHSYRQDEIVALLDLLDEFDITIGTLQHILEGYKVADRLFRHGAMASAFSDWWAYKFEVYDAIPDNGAIMHEAGVVVSFNSDDRELARHLNTEAAKAVKYGGVAPEDALKFVTLNPAKQLRIDDRVGSIRPGKDADLVVWSGPPLSTLSHCEQTWVDGRRMFSLDRDRELRRRDARWRSLLIGRVLDGDFPRAAPADDDRVDEEDRWLRYDAFCHVHDHDGHDDHSHHDHHEHDKHEHDMQEEQQ